MITEKCIFCDTIYKSPIDKLFDICPNCESSAIEDYDLNNEDMKQMIQTYSDKTLGENK